MVVSRRLNSSDTTYEEADGGNPCKVCACQRHSSGKVRSSLEGTEVFANLIQKANARDARSSVATVTERIEIDRRDERRLVGRRSNYANENDALR